jgi:hypothetical protein
MTKKDLDAARASFIDAYCAAFMAGYVAVNYSDICTHGRAADLAEPGGSHLAEDALCIAEAAWETYREFRYPAAFKGKTR